MRTLTVTKEKLATRCEICHQADRFDQALSTCKRCEGIVVVEQLRPDVKSPKSQNLPAREFQAVVAMSMSIASYFVIAAICSWYDLDDVDVAMYHEPAAIIILASLAIGYSTVFGIAPAIKLGIARWRNFAARFDKYQSDQV